MNHDNPASGPLNILIVEDDPIILFATSEMLADLGHSVFEAADAEQALAALEKDRFDILVTDLSLPGIPGNELAERAIAQYPDLRVIFASGYGALPASTASGVLGRAVLLEKPFSQQGLAKAISTTMSVER